MINRLSHTARGDISLSLSGRYHKCPSFAALTRDIYDVVSQSIKLISPRPSYENLYIYTLSVIGSIYHPIV